MNTLLWIIAVGFGVLALLGAAWALFADRSRGRRRCPKCFHAMDPKIGLVCPECGHDARDERRLFHTRRRWKMAIATMVVFGGMSLALSGLARVQQTGGWKDLPNWAAVRLLWIRDDKLDEDMLRRVNWGLLTHAQMLEVTREARRRIGSSDLTTVDSGIALLDKIARNSYGYSSDPLAIARPTLEELEPHLLYDALVDLAARDPTQIRKCYELMGHLKDADVRAVLKLIEGLQHVSGGYPRDACGALLVAYMPSQSGSVRRLPVAPPIALDFGSSQGWRGGPPPLPLATALGKNVAGFNGDLPAIGAWAQARWEEGLSDDAVSVVERLPELWLWCRMHDFGVETWSTVREASQNDDPLVQEYVVYLASGYEWSAEVEQLLRSALHAPNAEVQSAAVNAAARFGSHAKPLTSIILEQTASLQGAHGDSGLVDTFRKMGGRDEDLRDAIVRRLESIYDEHLDQLALDQRPTSPVQTLHADMQFWFLADIGLQDERAAAICRKYMSIGKVSPALEAAMAYAATSGERSEATAFILNHDPDVTQPMYVSSAQQTFLELVRRGLADPRMVMEHYADADVAKKGAFASMLRSYVWEPDILEPYLPLLNEMAGDSSDAVAQTEAAAVIAKYTKYRDVEKQRRR